MDKKCVKGAKWVDNAKGIKAQYLRAGYSEENITVQACLLKKIHLLDIWNTSPHPYLAGVGKRLVSST